LVSVFDPDADKERFAIVVGALDPKTLVGRIRRFTKQVALFKELVRHDRLGSHAIGHRSAKPARWRALRIASRWVRKGKRTRIGVAHKST
jgi:hypothetical protein